MYKLKLRIVYEMFTTMLDWRSKSVAWHFSEHCKYSGDVLIKTSSEHLHFENIMLHFLNTDQT